jgi:hypothetical protein
MPYVNIFVKFNTRLLLFGMVNSRNGFSLFCTSIGLNEVVSFLVNFTVPFKGVKFFWVSRIIPPEKEGSHSF